MLDLKLVRENPEMVEAALAKRHAGFTIKELVEVDSQLRKVQSEWEALNRRSNEISELFKTGKLASAEKEAFKAETKEVKARQTQLEEEKRGYTEQLEKLAMGIANMPANDVPEGKDEEDNVVVSTWGTIPSIKDPRQHYEIGADLGIFDFERGVKVAESRFTVLMNWGAKIERALMNFMLDSHRLHH